jgi:hypothetical protein
LLGGFDLVAGSWGWGVCCGWDVLAWICSLELVSRLVVMLEGNDDGWYSWMDFDGDKFGTRNIMAELSYSFVLSCFQF